MRKEVFLPALAFVGGVIGFFLRRWQLATAFEPDTGLPITGMPATWVLLALSLVMAAGLLLLCSGRHSAFPDGYDQAFRCASPLYVTCAIAAGFLLGVSGILKLTEFPTSSTTYEGETQAHALLASLPRILLVLFCFAAAVSIVLTAKNNYRGEKKGIRSLPLLAPPFWACMWLITAYQQRAADPVMMDYVYQLFAIIAILLALYFMAGFSFEKAKVTRTAYFSLLSVYLSCIALADTLELSSLLLYAFAILYLAPTAAVLLRNDRRPPEQQETEQSPEGGIQ